MKRVYVVVSEEGEIHGIFLHKQKAEEFVSDWNKIRYYIEDYPLDETQE